MFRPKNEIPYWKMIYNLVEPMTVGNLVSYNQLSEAIDQDITKNRVAVYQANKRLIKNLKKMLVVDRGNGYKLVEGMDMYYHAEDRHESAGKMIKLANYEASHIDTVKLSLDEKKTLNDFLVQNQNIAMALSQKVHRAEVASQYATVAAEHAQAAAAFSADELAKLRELLKSK